MKVFLNRDLCSGHARCTALAPEVYDSDDMGYCVLRSNLVPKGLEEKAQIGAMNCPEGALRIVED